MDEREQLRNLPLLAVLQQLGFNGWKTRKGGTEWAGSCPVHRPKKNQTSFSFDVEGRFNCFSCGAKGRGAIDLTMAVKGMRFNEAVTYLEGLHVHSPVQTPKATSIGATIQDVVSENVPYKGTYEKYAVESEWLENRGLSPETCKHYGVFEYNNPNRQSQYKGKILFPIRRFTDGELVGYLARTPVPKEGEAKYLFPPNLQKHLEVFGAFQLKGPAQLRRGYLVESPLTVLKFYDYGFPAVSPYGWSLSPEQVQILASVAKGWIYLPDKDKSDSVHQSVHRLSRHCWVKCPEFPATDPEHLTKEQILSL